MEGYSRKEENNNKGPPQLLNLISPVNGEWAVKRGGGGEQQKSSSHGLSEEKKLELRLGPPGGDEWSITDNIKNNNSFGYFQTNTNTPSAQKSHPWHQPNTFLHLQQLPVTKEPSQTGNSRVVETAAAEKKPVITAGTAHKRTAPGPVVGWPPVRSFRKNFTAGSSSKSASESPEKSPNQKPGETCTKGMFVKINMDGIPIGRKVDLKACDSYVKLSHAVDELFRGLIAAQNDTTGDGMKEKEDEGRKVIGGLLDGSGEYTLVYEDNEGDRMLVGDVPWHMFISTVKRLRVLKSSELPTLSRGNKQGKLSSLQAA